MNDIFKNRAKDRGYFYAMVAIEILVFKAKCGIFQNIGHLGKGNLRSFFFAMNIIEQMRAGAVINLVDSAIKRLLILPGSGRSLEK